MAEAIQRYPTIEEIYKKIKLTENADEANIVPEVYAILMHICLRCGYCWPKTPGVTPVRCANKACKSPYWCKPRKEEE